MNDKELAFEKRFMAAAAKEHLWDKGDRILLAVSGGVDSVVLAWLMKGSGADCAVAHCNFGLRGEESMRDEEFTEELSLKLKVPFYVKRFNTYEHAYRNGISVEMAARELRYEWFSELLHIHEMRFVATGHQADDQVETILLNLSRGTGISGMRGMLPKTGNIIRPLLPFFREEIEQYARSKGFTWIEDSSNKSVEIKRNLIRHRLVPLFEELNPGFRETMIRTARNARETELVYQERIREMLAPLMTCEGEVTKVSIKGLKALHPLQACLYELLSPFGFNRTTTEAVERALDGLSGKIFSSATHRVIKDRDHLVIVKGAKGDQDEWEYFINEDDNHMEEPLQLEFKHCDAAGFRVPDDPGQAVLDLDRLRFPLIVRKWQHGDTFYPLGMRNRKKLSDFFTDQKVSVYDKENIFVLQSGDDIVYVVGFRIDNRYRVTSKTRRVFWLRKSS